jgi:HNH endonuclease
MSASRETKLDRSEPAPDQPVEYVRVPAVIDATGDKVVTFYDEKGRPHTRPVAEVVLESFVGPRPPGHVVRFKDGDHLNCAVTNLEWAPVEITRPGDSPRARAIATRQRADAIRKTLEGRPHSDSADLVAEDRLR